MLPLDPVLNVWRRKQCTASGQLKLWIVTNTKTWKIIFPVKGLCAALGERGSEFLSIVLKCQNLHSADHKILPAPISSCIIKRQNAWHHPVRTFFLFSKHFSKMRKIFWDEIWASSGWGEAIVIKGIISAGTGRYWLRSLQISLIASYHNTNTLSPGGGQTVWCGGDGK